MGQVRDGARVEGFQGWGLGACEGMQLAWHACQTFNVRGSMILAYAASTAVERYPLCLVTSNAHRRCSWLTCKASHEFLPARLLHSMLAVGQYG